MSESCYHRFSAGKAAHLPPPPGRFQGFLFACGFLQFEYGIFRCGLFLDLGVFWALSLFICLFCGSSELPGSGV